VITNNPKYTMGYLNSLSNLETNICFLYQSLANKADTPFISGRLDGIAQDSFKHAKQLKAITGSSTYSEEKAKEYAKKLVREYTAVDFVYKEKMTRDAMVASQFLEITEKLLELENEFCAEYSRFLKEDVLEVLANETSGCYSITPGEIKSIFSGIINDKKQHKKMLAIVRGLLDQNKEKDSSKTPTVKFQSPGSWAYRQ
jgi:hypothetical protein